MDFDLPAYWRQNVVIHPDATAEEIMERTVRAVSSSLRTVGWLVGSTKNELSIGGLVEITPGTVLPDGSFSTKGARVAVLSWDFLSRKEG